MWLLEYIEPETGKETRIAQEKGRLTVQTLLSSSFRIENGIARVQGNAVDTLCDILLGLRMSRIQNRDYYDISKIEVALYGLSDQPESARYSLSTAASIIQSSEKAGYQISVTDLLTQQLPNTFQHIFAQEAFSRGKRTKGDYRFMDYRLECIPFAKYMEQEGNTSMKPGSGLVPDFAHPLDTGIIKVLDNPALKNAFSSVINLATDAQYGLMLASGIRVDQNDPVISEILRRCGDTLHINVPYTIVSSSVSGINAITVGTGDFVFIAISSLLKAVMSDDQLAFVLGHECGHIAVGHIVYHTVLNTARLLTEMIPLIGPKLYNATSLPLKAWSRRSEISADRAGLLCCGDLDVSCRTLLQIEAGIMNMDDFDLAAYIRDANQMLRRTAIGRFNELSQTHPLLVKRIEALCLFGASEKYYRLSGKTAPARTRLLSDSELEHRTEEILRVS